MPEYQTGKSPRFSLPAPCQNLKPDILSEHNSVECLSSLQQISILSFRRAVILGRQHIDTAASQLLGDRGRNIDIHVEPHRHLEDSLSAQSDCERRFKRSGGLIDLLHFVFNFRVDLLLMIEIVSQGGVNLRGIEVRVLSAHLLCRPSVRKVIHDDLSHPNAGNSFQSGWLPGGFGNVRVGYLNAHFEPSRLPFSIPIISDGVTTSLRKHASQLALRR
jgi:hypothetical protein